MLTCHYCRKLATFHEMPFLSQVFHIVSPSGFSDDQVYYALLRFITKLICFNIFLYVHVRNMQCGFILYIKGNKYLNK